MQTHKNNGFRDPTGIKMEKMGMKKNQRTGKKIAVWSN